MGFVDGRHRFQGFKRHGGIVGKFAHHFVAIESFRKSVVGCPNQAVLKHAFGGAPVASKQDGLGFLGLSHDGFAPIEHHGAVAVLGF